MEFLQTFENVRPGHLAPVDLVVAVSDQQSVPTGAFRAQVIVVHSVADVHRLPRRHVLSSQIPRQSQRLLEDRQARLLHSKVVRGQNEGEVPANLGVPQNRLQSSVEIRDDAQNDVPSLQKIQEIDGAGVLVPALARAVTPYQAVGDLGTR